MKKIVTLILSIILLTAASGALAHYQNTKEPEANSGGLMDQLNTNLRKQEELRKKIADAQNQEKSLSSEIAYLDNQIELTTLYV